MSNIFTRKIIVFTSLFLLSISQVFPANSEEHPPTANRGNPLSVTANNPSVNSSINIKTSDAGIVLNVANSFLSDVLQQVANHSHIEFNVGNQLTSHRVSVNIQGPNWNSVIKTLLKDFSKVTVWNKKSKGMKEVLLLGKNNWSPQVDFETSSDDNRVMRGKNRSQGLSVSQLKNLVRIPSGISLPPSLFADQEIRRYLNLKGIQSPEEWKEPGKVRTVLHIAKRELNRLLFEKQLRQKFN